MLHKAIKGFEDYLVTDTGRVYSLKSGKYLKLHVDKDGYLRVGLYRQKRYLKGVHRLVAEAFIENLENKPTVDHINRNKTDNRPENLRWADISEQNKNKDFTEKRREHNRSAGKIGGKKRGEQLAVNIIEIKGSSEIFYNSMTDVPNIGKTTLSYHITNGEKEFWAKGRHFKVEGRNE